MRGGKIMNNTTFCENCRNDVNFSIKKKNTIRSFKNEEIEFEETFATCNNCENEVFVADLHDCNLFSLYDSYRLKNGILAIEDIRNIPIEAEYSTV